MAPQLHMPAPRCLIENREGKLAVCQDALRLLSKIGQPVVVVAVVGLYRTGKSYLMNKLAGKNTGFPLGSTVQANTKGIWMRCVPFPGRPDQTLVLLDTEGLGNVEKADAKNDIRIFTLAFLLSSTLIYNSFGTIDQQAMEKLHYVMELTKRIKTKSFSGENPRGLEDSVCFFPSFVWALRDFTLQLQLNNEPITADEYLENALKLKEGDSSDTQRFNLPRECIRLFFPTRKCFILGRPTRKENLHRLEEMEERDLDPDFVEQASAFCRYIYDTSKKKTIPGGHVVTGRLLANLVAPYVDTISIGEVPCIEKVVSDLAEIENSAAVHEAAGRYEELMQQKLKLPTETLQDLLEIHSVCEKEAVGVFMARSFKDDTRQFQDELMKTLCNKKEEYCDMNKLESRKRCLELLTRLSRELEEGIKNGKYTQPGSYQNFLSDQQAVVEKYRKEPGKGVMAEEILEEFLKEKDTVGKAILQNDEALVEKQRETENVKKKTEKLCTPKCHFCGNLITDGMSTTSNLLRDIKTHTGKHEEFKRDEIQNECSTSDDDASRETKLSDFRCVVAAADNSNAADTTVDNSSSTSSVYGLNHSKQKIIVKSIVNDLIIGCSLPLSLVERPQFRRFCAVLDPSSQVTTRAVVAMELERQYEKVKEEVTALLQKADNVALTIDIWLDRKMQGFIGVTAHMILKFKLRTRLLACQRFLGRHTDENVFDVFKSICASFKVKDKIRYVVTDNAANRIQAFTAEFPPADELSASQQESAEETSCDLEGSTGVENSEYWEDVGEEMIVSLVQQANSADQTQQPVKRLACFMHTLQLSVSAGLKEAKINTALAKVSEICSLLHTSTVFKDAFKRSFGPNVSIPHVANNRWNTTLHRINAFLELGDAQLKNVLDEVNQTNLKPSVREYSQLKELSQILQPFLEATTAVQQADKEVTISAVVPSVVGLYHHLRNMQPVHLGNMVAALKESLETWFAGILVIAGLLPMPQGQAEKPLSFHDYLYFIAAVLDPNFYFWWLQKISDNEDETAALKQQVLSELRRFCITLNQNQPSLLSQSSSAEVAPRKQACVSSLFAYFKPKAGNNSDSDQTDFDAEMCFYSKLVLSLSAECGPINVLGFWEKHCKELRLLSAAALNVFLVPASSAPVERVFSEGRIVMRPPGSNLVEKIVFLKCNLDQFE